MSRPGTLEAWLQSDHSWNELLAVSAAIAAAVEAKVREGEVYGGIAPATLKLGSGPVCEITSDARLHGGGGDSPYLAPEVRSGRLPSDSADVYSAGAVIYQILSRRPSFDGAETPLADVNPAVPADISDAVKACLEADSAWRPRDLSYLLQVTSQAAQGRSGAAVPAVTARVPGKTGPSIVPMPRTTVGPAAAASLKSLQPKPAATGGPPIVPIAAAVVLLIVGGAGYWWLKMRPAPGAAVPAAAGPTVPAASAPPPSSEPPAAGPTTAAEAAAPPTTLSAAASAAPPTTVHATASAPPSTLNDIAATPPPTTAPAAAAAPPTTTAATSAPAPTGPPLLKAVSPTILRPSSETVIDLHGENFREGMQMRFTRQKGGDVTGITITRQRVTNPTLMLVALKLGAVPQGLYLVAVVDPQGNLSNALPLQIKAGK